jgi:hypothetical protein
VNVDQVECLSRVTNAVFPQRDEDARNWLGIAAGQFPGKSENSFDEVDPKKDVLQYKFYRRAIDELIAR